MRPCSVLRAAAMVRWGARSVCEDGHIFGAEKEFSEARVRLGFDCCLECGKKEAAAEIARPLPVAVALL